MMTPQRWNNFPVGTVISFLLAGIVFASVWCPEFSHWYVSPAPTTISVIEKARIAPEQRVLEEVATMRLGALVLPLSQAVSSAEQIMQGILVLPGFPPASINLPFAPEDLERGSPTFQLLVASLVSADILLDAYEITRRETFLNQARDIIVGFAEYEKSQWLDRGLLWNDHAVAARIPVLVKFWAKYRAHSEFDPRVGRIVLDLAARGAQLLAKPSFYAWRTSHGILSDLAILQISLAFPELKGIAALRNIATDRFTDHLNYWINKEGVTLLHSAGYHAGSLYHFGVALRLYTLSGITIPDGWWQRYTKAVEFHSLLRRPDGTLPMYGDTNSMSSDTRALLTTKRESGGGAAALSETTPSLDSDDVFALYPLAGHAIWWDGFFPASSVAKSMAAQTTITWSYHPGLGHKVADEPSMIVWGSGRTWLTNTGYWPYGVWGRENAESWEASNAPHLLGESKDSERISRVRAQGKGKGIFFIDLERRGPQDYTVRRQIARLTSDNTWIVIDHSSDSADRTTTSNWTFYPDLSATPLATKGQYWITAPDSRVGMLSTFSGSEGFNTDLTVGRERPFAGWIVLERTPTRAPAIVIRQPSQDGWCLATFTLADKSQSIAVGEGGRLTNWIDAEHWMMVLHSGSSEVFLTRTGDRLTVHHSNLPSGDEVINLAAGEAAVADIAEVREAFQAASQSYRKFPELMAYRVKVSETLITLLIIQELLLFAMRRRFLCVAQTLRFVGWVAWTGGGFWLSQTYLAAPA